MRLSLSITLLSLAELSRAEEPTCSASDESCQVAQTCGLWLSKSSLFPDMLGIFSGTEVASGQSVGEGEVVLPMFDANENEWSLWHDLSWNSDMQDDLLMQNQYQNKVIIPGLASNLVCSANLSTLYPKSSRNIDSLGVHRSKDPSAGSFSYRHQFEFAASQTIYPGQELFASCSAPGKDETETSAGRIIKPLGVLEEEGVCIDNISVKPSTIPAAGRGAFAKRSVKKGDVIVSSPVAHFDRSQTEIVKQRIDHEGFLEYTEFVEQQQLVLNYCYGHPDSTVLLLPYGPGVNFINHNKEPNAILDWTQSDLQAEDLLDETVSDLLQEKDSRLIVDYVALRDIEAGEEIFLDYGRDWETAWEEYNQAWEAPKDSEGYVSATDYAKAHPDDLIRTVQEQAANPYPDNIVTACDFCEPDDMEAVEGEAIQWTQEDIGCLRPCTIMESTASGDSTVYSVEMNDVVNLVAPDYYLLTNEGLKVLNVPASAISLVDKEYTSDQHLKSAFRHEIGFPKDLYPEDWMSKDTMPMGDFLQVELEPGQIEPIRWADSGDIVTPNGYVMGLKPHVRQSLLEYCERTGITDMFRNHTYRGNALTPGDDKVIQVDGLNWFVQRPQSHWNSNMHWISPTDAPSHDDYLRALSAAGFDEVMDQIGTKFGFKGLAAYHVTFIGVSYCSQGYMHYDVTETGAKTYNVIIPLILADDTGPELDVEHDRHEVDDPPVGRVRYQYDVAVMNGDDCYHATSAIDYRVSKKMRMAATVYIADIDEDNVDAIMSDYTQNYPPAGRTDILLEMAGTHWQRDDPSVKLPKPRS